MADYEAWRDRLAEGMDPRFYRIEHIDAQLADETAFFIANDKAALVFEVKEFPTGLQVIHALIAAGDAGALVNEIRERTENLGRNSGLTAALVESRPGWEKALRKHGYSVFQVSLIKEL